MSRVRNFSHNGERLWVEQYLDRATVYDSDGMPYARLSVHLEGEKAPAGFFFCKAYSENEALVLSMIQSETLTIIGEPLKLPPFGATVLVARVNANHEGVN